MGKAYLILDEMPKDCSECELEGTDAEREETCCLSVPGAGCNKQYFGTEKRPDWCPLRPLPEYEKHCCVSEIILKAREQNVEPSYYNGYQHGWNTCLDEILGGTNDRQEESD